MLGIVTLNWNGFADTVRCLESLGKSDLSATRVYVVDNGSANNEAEKLAEAFPWVTVLPQKENTGFCKGNNIGFERAIADGCELLVMLNNDTIIPPEAINILAQEFRKLPDAGAVSPVIVQYPEVKGSSFIRAEWQPDKAQFILNPDKKEYVDVKDEKPWVSEFANGCCLLTTAEIWKRIGPLDERYFAYYDEADWCRRLSAAGYNSYVSPASFIYHVKETGGPPTRVSTYLLTRNRLLWMKENLSLKDRNRSFGYMTREFFWHLFNLIGLTRGNYYSKDISQAFLIGWRDGKLKRFGRWQNDKFFRRR